jgi:hypothetical protein
MSNAVPQLDDNEFMDRYAEVPLRFICFFKNRFHFSGTAEDGARIDGIVGDGCASNLPRLVAFQEAAHVMWTVTVVKDNMKIYEVGRGIW